MDNDLEIAMDKIKCQIASQIEARNNRIQALKNNNKINKIKVENYDVIEVAMQEAISNVDLRRDNILNRALFHEISYKLRKHTKGLNRKLVKNIIGSGIANAYAYTRAYYRDFAELTIQYILEELKEYMIEKDSSKK